MANASIQLNITSARDLKNVNTFSEIKTYLLVSLNDPRQQFKSPVDREGGSNPNWNFPIKLTFNDSLAKQNRLSLLIKIRCHRFFGDKTIGNVVVPLKELMDSASGDGKCIQFVSYQVRKPSGKPCGVVNFSYKFEGIGVSSGIGKVNGGDEPVMAYPAVGPSSVTSAPPHMGPPPQGSTGYAYPAPQAQGGYGYPPQHAQGGYGYPPQQAQGGYGYPPQQAQGGYGYPPVQQPVKKKNKLGMGMGAGLLGGMLGGLLIGDMVSDAGGYDGGFDSGFGDGGGFDF